MFRQNYIELHRPLCDIQFYISTLNIFSNESLDSINTCYFFESGGWYSLLKTWYLFTGLIMRMSYCLSAPFTKMTGPVSSGRLLSRDRWYRTILIDRREIDASQVMLICYNVLILTQSLHDFVYISTLRSSYWYMRLYWCYFTMLDAYHRWKDSLQVLISTLVTF